MTRVERKDTIFLQNKNSCRIINKKFIVSVLKDIRIIQLLLFTKRTILKKYLPSIFSSAQRQPVEYQILSKCSRQNDIYN